jgi:hypothetical protein
MAQCAARQIVDCQVKCHTGDKAGAKQRPAHRYLIKEPQAEAQQAEAAEHRGKGADGKELRRGRERHDGFADGGKRGNGKSGGTPKGRAALAALGGNGEKCGREDLRDDEVHSQQRNRTTHRRIRTFMQRKVVFSA